MEIIVNGENKNITSGTCVEDYLQELDLNIETVVIECDGVILKRKEYPGCILQEGSVLEIIRFIGGG